MRVADQLITVTVVSQFNQLAHVRIPLLSKVASKLPGERSLKMSHDNVHKLSHCCSAALCDVLFYMPLHWGVHLPFNMRLCRDVLLVKL